MLLLYPVTFFIIQNTDPNYLLFSSAPGLKWNVREKHVMYLSAHHHISLGCMCPDQKIQFYGDAKQFRDFVEIPRWLLQVVVKARTTRIVAGYVLTGVGRDFWCRYLHGTKGESKSLSQQAQRRLCGCQARKRPETRLEERTTTTLVVVAGSRRGDGSKSKADILAKRREYRVRFGCTVAFTEIGKAVAPSLCRSFFGFEWSLISATFYMLSHPLLGKQVFSVKLSFLSW